MTKKGFSLVDTIVALGLLVLLTGILTQVILSESAAWARARAERNVVDAGQTILERLTSEIRLAESVNMSQSAFGSHPGRLYLNTFETPTSTAATTLDISLSGTDLVLDRGNAPATTISTGARVTNFVVYRMAATSSDAIRIELTVETGAGRFETEREFATAAALRNSY